MLVCYALTLTNDALTNKYGYICDSFMEDYGNGQFHVKLTA